MSGLFALANVAVAATPVDQPLPGYAFITDPVREVTAGLTSTLAVKVQALGPLPIDWVAIAPASSAKLVSAMGLSGWAPRSLTGNRAVFVGRKILPGGSWEFNLQIQGASVAGAVPAADTTVPLTVEVSHDNGAHKRLFTPPPHDPAGLSVVIRVLRVLEGPAITAPAQAGDGTVTSGQNNLTVGATVRNFGSGTLTPTAALTADNATIPAASTPVTLAPGETKALSYDVVAGTPGTVTFGLSLTSASPSAQASAGSVTSAVEPAPVITCRTVSAGGDDWIFSPEYSVVYDKSGTPSLDVSSYTLTINTTPAFGPAAIVDGTVPGGDLAAQQLSFPPVAVPATVPENDYGTTLAVAAIDSNGAPLAASTVACPQIRVDIQEPRLVDATMTEIDSALRQIRIDPDARIRTTFSEVIEAGVDSAEDWIPLDAHGNRVSGVTVQAVEPCSDAATTCRTLTLDAGFSDAWKQIATLHYCREDLETSYRDLVGNHAACGSEVGVTQ